MTEPEEGWIDGLPVFEQAPAPSLPPHVQTARAAEGTRQAVQAHEAAIRSELDEELSS